MKQPHFLFSYFFIILLLGGKIEKSYAVISNTHPSTTSIDSNCVCFKNILTCGINFIVNLQFSRQCFYNSEIFNKVKFHLDPIMLIKKDEFLVGKEKNVTHLTFINGSISYYSKNGIFDNFSALEMLSFWSTDFPALNESILSHNLGLTLKHLSITNNRLAFLSSNTFHHMNNLVNLYLRENDKVGQVINDGIFVESLSNLYRMDLVKCNITHLDMNVFINLTKLEILELSKNPLFSLPSAIKVLPRLFALWMFQTNVTTVGFNKNVYNRNLEYIVLSSDYLTDIYKCAFCNFPRLSKLDLSFNPKLKCINKNAFGRKTTTSIQKIIWPSKEYDISETCNASKKITKNFFAIV